MEQPTQEAAQEEVADMSSPMPQVTTLADLMKVVQEGYKSCDTVLKYEKDPDRSFRMRMIIQNGLRA